MINPIKVDKDEDLRVCQSFSYDRQFYNGNYTKYHRVKDDPKNKAESDGFRLFRSTNGKSNKQS